MGSACAPESVLAASLARVESRPLDAQQHCSVTDQSTHLKMIQQLDNIPMEPNMLKN